MLRIEENKDLQPYNTFGVSAQADYFIEFTESTSIRTFLAEPPHYLKDIFILGGGSNVLFTKDYNGCVIHPANKGFRVTVEDSNSVVVEVQAGEDWDVFVQWAVSHNLGGVENLTAIPGRVGACAVQNIGAYGAEVKDNIVSVEIIDLETGDVSHLSAQECNFGYRDSIFKNELKDKCIILSVLFRLTKKPVLNTDYAQVQEVMDQFGRRDVIALSRSIREIRNAKLPDPWALGNAGSFFKNPVVDQKVADELGKKYEGMPVYPSGVEGTVKLAAGWLIDQAGWKGKRDGDVGIHENQALVIVNYGNATGDQIVAFSEKIQKSVKKKFGIALQPEVKFV